MPKIESLTPLHPDVPTHSGYGDSLQGYHTQYQQVVTNLGKYVVDNRIAAIVAISYPFDGYSLGNKLKAETLTNVFEEDVNGGTFSITAAAAGYDAESRPTLELCEFVTKQANKALLKYDLLLALTTDFLGSGPDNPTYPGNSKAFYLVTVKGKTYLGLHEEGSDRLQLLHFVTLSALVSFFKKFEASDLWQKDLYFEWDNLTPALGYQGDFERVAPLSWGKPTPIDPALFTSPTPINSEFNPFLVGDAWMIQPNFGLEVEDVTAHVEKLMDPKLFAQWVPALESLRDKLSILVTDGTDSSETTTPPQISYLPYGTQLDQLLWSEEFMQFATNLSKYLIDNQIGAIVSSTYEVKSGGYLGDQVDVEAWFDLFEGDPNKRAFTFTGKENGWNVEVDSRTLANLTSSIPRISHYDLLLSIGGQFLDLDYSTTVNQPMQVVAINGSYYLSMLNPEGTLITLFSFIPVRRLSSLYSWRVEVGDYHEEWYTPTPIPLSVFQTNTSLTSGYNPFLFWASNYEPYKSDADPLPAKVQQRVQSLPPHLQKRMVRAIRAQARHLWGNMIY